MKLITIRHGLTPSNQAGILQGQRVDDKLSPEGHQQAERLAQEIGEKSESVAAIYSSPLRRTKETAEYVSKVLGLPIIEKEEIKERDFGTLSGKTWSEIPENKDNQLKQKDKAFVYDYRPFGGESVSQVRQRLQSFLEFVRQKHEAENIICVTHGGILRLLYDELRQTQPKELPPGSVHIFNI